MYKKLHLSRNSGTKIDIYLNTACQFLEHNQEVPSVVGLIFLQCTPICCKISNSNLS